MEEERRQASRISVSLEAKWKGIMSGDTAQVTNLSTVGCFLETSGRVLNREMIDIEIKTPGGEWLTLQGQVIYRIPEGGLGIFFVEITGEERYVLNQLIEQCNSSSTAPD